MAKTKSFILRIDSEMMDAIEAWAADEFRFHQRSIAMDHLGGAEESQTYAEETEKGGLMYVSAMPLGARSQSNPRLCQIGKGRGVRCGPSGSRPV